MEPELEKMLNQLKLSEQDFVKLITSSKVNWQSCFDHNIVFADIEFDDGYLYYQMPQVKLQYIIENKKLPTTAELLKFNRKYIFG